MGCFRVLHLFELCYDCGGVNAQLCQQPTYKRNVPIRRRNTSRKAARKRTPNLTISTSERASVDFFARERVVQHNFMDVTKRDI